MTGVVDRPIVSPPMPNAQVAVAVPDPGTDYLIGNIRRAVALGYNIEPGWVWWNPAHRGGQGGKDIRGLRSNWQRLGGLPLAEIERRIRTGTANGYLVHGSTSCPQLGGVTLLDGDTDDECRRISAAVGGAVPHVRSGSGWWHWYAVGVLKSSVALKTKDTAFGPGSWYLGPDGQRRTYAGALPGPAELARVAVMPATAPQPQPAGQPTGINPTASFWQTAKTVDTAARQWERLHDRTVGFVRRCEMFGWSGAHTQLLELTRELAQLAPEHAHRAIGEWFREGGAGYVDNRVWTMLDTALGKYPADEVEGPAPAGVLINGSPQTAGPSMPLGESGVDVPITVPALPTQEYAGSDGGPGSPLATGRVDVSGGTAVPAGPTAEQGSAPRRLPMIADPVWDAYGWTRSIRAQARAADVCPDAVLGAMLASYASRVPPSVRVVTGTKMPLGTNLVVSLVGPSGSDKSTAFALAQRMMNAEWPSSVPVIANPGSGEAFAANLTRPDPDWQGPARQCPKVLREDPRVLFYVSEGALLGSVAGRLGSTWLPHLRALAVDESLSTSNATAEINRQVPAQRYRAAVVVGYQVTTATTVLHDTGTGTAQRFLWFTSLSSEDVAPGHVDAPYVPMAVPNLTRLGQGVDDLQEAVHLLTVTRSITDRIITEQRHERLTRDITATDDHDAHRHMLVAKLAALAVLADGRVMIDESDWLWAEALYGASAATRDELLDIADDAARTDRVSIGRRLADTDRARKTYDGDEVRVAQTILNRVTKLGGSATKRSITQAVAGRDRSLIPGALEQLVSSGYLVRQTNGRFTQRYN
jgi:hypothetical protein